jgi:hypothetical protein
MSYPRRLNDDRNDEDNERSYAELLSTHPYMQSDVIHGVLVKENHGKDERYSKF